MDDFGGSESWMFSVAPGFIGIMFVILFIIMIFQLFNGAHQWKKNKVSPRLMVPAIVKSKRTKVWGHVHANDQQSSSAAYFSTFEFEGGDRFEFRLSGEEFGMLAEGDSGTLTFQGTRYLGFARKDPGVS
ncbi:DUF2500 domain-containing protein [Peribacillus sp. SI8-4]|uniref:DUF2500 domain-containing protein n=1 Tax=Peribacillus sp. SI8-4 TaxID=3048009 RepID=UPI002555DFBF|nr:DUF2500 domain-containing protein [Peribacillus sp. SI8-4]